MTILVLCVVLLMPTALFAQQRVIIEKGSDRIVDYGELSLRYDSRRFDNLEFPNNTIPAGADPAKFRYDRNSGAVIARDKTELADRFKDEWQEDAIARITASITLTPELKQLLIGIIRRL